MPNMADLVVKKADGTTDITYEALTPSSGDKTEAKWRVNAAGASNAAPILRATLGVKSKSSVNGQVRIVEGKYVRPVSVTEGSTTSTKMSIVSFTATIDQSLTDVETAEYAAQVANLLKATLMQTVLKTGYAPT